MAKKKRKMIETMEFDSYEQAKDMVDGAQKKVVRIRIGMVIAAAATFCTVYGLGHKPDTAILYLLLAFVLAIPAYIVGGGIGTALRAAKKLAVFGWFIMPFPTDIVTGLCTLVIAIFGFFFIPLVFVFINYVQHNRDYKEAKKYLQYFKPVAVGEQADENLR